jgi:signal transduction histidine kinase
LTFGLPKIIKRIGPNFSSNLETISRVNRIIAASSAGQNTSPGIRRHFLYLLLGVLIPIFLLLLVISFDRFQAQRKASVENNKEMVRVVSGVFQDFTEDVLRQEIAIGVVLSRNSFTRREANQFLIVNAAQFPPLKDISWANPSGKILFSPNPKDVNRDISDRPYFREIAGGGEWAVSDLFPTKTGGSPVFTISRGIRDQSGTLKGLIIATVLPEKLKEVYRFKRARQSAITIIDRSGRAVFRNPGVDWSWEERGRYKVYPGLKEALKGKEVTGVVQRSEDGVKRVFALAPIPELGWVGGASIAEKEMMAPVFSSLLADTVLFSGVTLASLFLALVFSRKITGPIKRLQKAVRDFGKGKWHQEITLAGPKEIEDFAKTFNEMATEVKRLTEDLNRKNCELEISNRDLDAFSSTVAHDLKTPLIVVDYLSQKLAKDYTPALNSKGTRYLEELRTSASQMMDLVNDLLEFSRASKTAMKAEKADLSVFAQEALEACQKLRPEIPIEAVIPERVYAWGDKSLLRCLFNNLIGNACKFSSHSERPRIEFGANGIGGERIFFIADNGCGFEMAAVDQIFLPFKRLHPSDQYPGTGIGLAIVKRVVERHGGRIWAESEPGRGATFYFTLKEFQRNEGEDIGAKGNRL